MFVIDDESSLELLKTKYDLVEIESSAELLEDYNAAKPLLEKFKTEILSD